MNFGLVQGSVVASQKVQELRGMALKVLQPCDENKNPLASSSAVVVVDSIGARVGDFVMWVSKREASLAISGAPLTNLYPVDAAITGIIDDLS